MIFFKYWFFSQPIKTFSQPQNMSQNKKHRKHKSKRKRKTKSSDEEESDDDEIDGWKLETIDGIPTFVQELPKPKENPFSPVVLNIKDKCSLIQLSDDKLTALIGQHVFF